MRLIFAGTPAPAVTVLRSLLDSSHEVVAVLTRAPARAGRGRKLQPSRVEELARSRGIEVLTPSSLRDAAVAARLAELAPDAIPTVAYGRLVPPELLEIAPHGWINVHFSLLPAWRGAAPVQRALMAGDEVGGVSVFRIDEGLDTGPVFGTATRAFAPRETAGQALEALADVGAQLLGQVLAGLEAGRVVAVAQETDGVSLAPRLTVEDAQVRFAAPALAIDRLIRAVTPAPGAWTTWAGARLKLGPVELEPTVRDLAPGQLWADKKRVLVGTGSHAVRLGLVAPAGKAMMQADAWARGARLQPGALLGGEEN
ncbi:methionyl-tRNA formyltransferase [Buchananella hordeovulneris]|uniref:methionyl-tRNA formyltransferase n=1 Tax=Buchananella hordeovulneris TaxID=52770 RepID=UPI000F5F3BB6|nr:methionyl-tRNA formyltransferase [Buchananella hordeovulneris]RRD45391.1 methionyl-tRNA formyltransferase [Buchananella hordeovulneris]